MADKRLIEVIAAKLKDQEELLTERFYIVGEGNGAEIEAALKAEIKRETGREATHVAWSPVRRVTEEEARRYDAGR
jgi:hypothetical protein